MNLNSKEYWEERFATGDWAREGGHVQSESHALHYLPCLRLPADFSGSICDFGCAEGDAMPIYRRAFPKASLIGVDFSDAAILSARKKYGNIARFLCRDVFDMPESDVITSSHAFEHLEDDTLVLRELLGKCERLFVIVPYKEEPLGKEHLRRYDKRSYAQFCPIRKTVCSAGWKYQGASLIYQIYIKNLIRPVFGRRVLREPRQIVFEFSGIK